MARKSKRRPLLVEMLETRLYLSAAAEHGDALDIELAEPLPVAHRFIATDDLSAEISSLRAANQLTVFVLELDSESRLTVMGRTTGQTESITIAPGRVVVVTELTNLPSGMSLSDALVVDLAGLDSAPARGGADRVGSASDNAVDPPVRGPILVVIQPPPDEEGGASNLEEPDSPPRSVTLFVPGWLGGLNGSAWWTYTLNSRGGKSRLDSLEWDKPGGAGLEIGGGLDAGVADEFGSGSLLRSRVLLRSPARLMVFTTPLAHDASGAVELTIYDFATGQITRTGETVVSPLTVVDGRIAFLGLESDAELAAVTVQAPTLKVFHPASGGIRSTGIRAEAIRAEGGQVVLGIKSPTGKPLAARGSTLTAHRYDPITGRLTNLQRPYQADPEPRVSRASWDGGKPASDAGLAGPVAASGRALPASPGHRIDSALREAGAEQAGGSMGQAGSAVEAEGGSGQASSAGSESAGSAASAGAGG